MAFLKRNIAAVAGGALILVGGSYVGARALTAPAGVTLDAANAPVADTTGAPDTATSKPDPSGEKGPIRGEAVIARGGQFPTVRFNRGVLDSVDGSTLVIKELDGTTVRVDTNDKTRFRRDGEKATLGDLKPGDHVGTLEVKTGDGYETKFVRAFSADKWQQHTAEKQQRRASRKP